MKNITSTALETLEESEYPKEAAEIAHLLNDNKTSLVDSDTILTEDDLFHEILFNEEYVIWEEGVSSILPANRKAMSRVFEEDELGMPAEESLHHLGEWFTLKRFPPSKKNY